MSCEKSTYPPSPSSNENTTIKTTNTIYCNLLEDLDDFALALSHSLNNSSIGSLIKSKVLDKFDGDFEILLKEIESCQLKNGKEFNVIMNSHLKKSGNSIQSLIEKYPKLQIAIPRKCINWDPENYNPLVAYYNPLKDEKSITKLIAYNFTKRIEIDAKTEYNHPVIVIGFNERTDEHGKVLYNSKTESLLKNTNNKNVRSALYHLKIKKIYLYNDHEPWYKGAAEIIGHCRVNPSCSRQHFTMTNVDYSGSWYSGNWSVWTQTTCDDLSGDWWWSWIGLEIWEDDWPDNDDVVDWHFKTTSGGYNLTFGVLSYPQECIGYGNGHAKIIAEQDYY